MIYELHIREDKARAYRWHLSQYFKKRKDMKLDKLIMMAVREISLKHSRIELKEAESKVDGEK